MSLNSPQPSVLDGNRGLPLYLRKQTIHYNLEAPQRRSYFKKYALNTDFNSSIFEQSIRGTRRLGHLATRSLDDLAIRHSITRTWVLGHLTLSQLVTRHSYSSVRHSELDHLTTQHLISAAQLDLTFKVYSLKLSVQASQQINQISEHNLSNNNCLNSRLRRADHSGEI